MRNLVLVGLGIMGTVYWAAPAEAWVHTMTCRENAGPNDPLACQEGEVPQPLYWNAGCVVYHTNQTGLPENEDPEDVYEAIRRSFAEWDGQSCSGLSLIEGGFTNEDRVGYNSCDPAKNANIVIFRDRNWRHQAGALALTSVTYDLRTGEIVDADMELNNTGQVVFTTSDLITQVVIDVQNTVTHEIGHIVGLDHSPVEEATMFATAPRGEIKKRDLAEDDILGLCTIYPADLDLPCDTSNVGYFSRPSEGPGADCDRDNKGCPCTSARSRPLEPHGWLLFALVIGWSARGRRRAPGAIR